MEPEVQAIKTKRQEALAKAGYSNLDSLYAVNEELRRLYGPDIIKELDGA